MLPASASAATFVLTSGSNNDGSIGNVRTYTGSDGTQLEVTAYSLAGGSTLSAGAVGAYTPGLGVINSFGWNGDGSHTVDNSGNVDILVFQFNKVVTVDKVGLAAFGDTDINYAIGSTVTPFSGTLSIPNYATFTSLFGSSILSNGTGSDENRDINPSNLSGNLFYVAAAFSNSSSNDSFKVSGITYTATPAVPEPATWGMMICGLGLAGAAMRRRKANASVSFA
ncbi:MAG: PEP-CTERM sorting domain-containing protein [Sphingomonas sp.]|nr:PEP-CTERM sorting domain-containing protein [Sphingomonas sp.]